MAKNTLTFELGGRVEIASFADAMAAFRRLVTALTPKSAGVTWVVEDLQPGSAVVTLRGEALDPHAVERIVNDYEKIGAGLERHIDLPLTNSRILSAASAVQNLTSIAEYVRLQTPDVDHTVYRNGYTPDRFPPTVSVGGITGRIQTLSNRTGLRFNLYDNLHDRAVACYLTAGQEELMREAWGRRATVTGRISRDSRSGRPIAVRQIVGLNILDDAESGSYLNARGAVQWEARNGLPEDIIRELRDA